MAAGSEEDHDPQILRAQCSQWARNVTRFAPGDIVEAHRHADTEHKVGNVVIVGGQV
jgi:hypothetical protein